MSRHYSLYLDLMRFVAAVAVLLSHANSRNLTDANILPPSLGHNAVIVFFLLSGYVIAYVADTKERNAHDYWISRLTRIYSVALPAVLLAPMFDWAGSQINPAFYAGSITTHDYAWVRVAASLTFTNELWLVSIMPFSNSAYWSLCYEMAYYLLFAIWCFAPAAKRCWWLALAMLLIGPKILLLAPIWILGVVLYRARRGYDVSECSAWMLWIGSVVGVVAYQWFDVTRLISAATEKMLGPWLYTQLHFSKHFLGDYLLAVLIAANFIGFRRIADRFAAVFSFVGPFIRKSASYTFSIYLFHLPILHFYTVAIDGSRARMSYYVIVVGLTLATAILLGTITEQQKDRLKKWLTACAGKYRRVSQSAG